MNILLVLCCVLTSVFVEGRNVRFQQVPNPVMFEPSSRDLDVGIAIGVPEDDNSVDNNLNMGAIGSNGGLLYNMPPVQNTEPLHLVINQQGVPVPVYPGQYSPEIPPSNMYQNLQPVPLYATRLQQGIPYKTEIDPVPLYPQLRQQSVPLVAMEPPSLYPMQYQQDISTRSMDDMEQIPLNPAALPVRQPQVVYNQQGIPVMTSRPYGDRRVGAFRLRNDRGYQVMMEVPPSPPGATGGGVLVMEMQATLYRPMQ